MKADLGLGNLDQHFLFLTRMVNYSFFLRSILFVCLLSIFCGKKSISQLTSGPVLFYSVSVAGAQNHAFKVGLDLPDQTSDTLKLTMPEWMPGYYQLMHYAKEVSEFRATDKSGKRLSVLHKSEDSWLIYPVRNKSVKVQYQVKAEKRFVANSFVDTTHGYIIPGSLFMYANDLTRQPVRVTIFLPAGWKDVVTGLSQVDASRHSFYAKDFDVLYDCPILMGNLTELPSFTVGGKPHRFVGYGMVAFDHKVFMNQLQKVVQSAADIIGDIPYDEYTFIGIGPGQGGIEHLNNTTVSFDGRNLQSPAGINRMMNFLAHEYFHHYNIKRIRPFELGPFNYQSPNRTNLLWVSEGLSVYYEYLIVHRAGLISDSTLLANFSGSITAFENGPGKYAESLTQASYETWDEGPFGKQGPDADKAISYYEKGPVVGLMLDFAIREATRDSASLDDVMRLLYRTYYQRLQRGFTDAEFQDACEAVAGKSLREFFEYVYTAKPLDYDKYLGFGGLGLNVTHDPSANKNSYSLYIKPGASATARQLFAYWLHK